MIAERASTGSGRRSRRGVPVHGVLLLNKPAGLSSNQALQQTRRIYGAAKAGHTGSLDPLATGMLPVCFGEATKLSGALLDAKKAYRVRAALGVATRSGDAEGEVIARASPPALEREAWVALLQRFTGAIEQVPPMYSALKQGGRRLYELARQGIDVERPARSVVIHRLSLVEVSAEAVDLEVVCSKGTYIRTLVEDIAEAAGSCAHVAFLRRLWVDPFQDAPLYDFAALEEAAASGRGALGRLLWPVDSLLRELPAVRLGAGGAERFCQGQAVVAGQPGEGADADCRVYDESDILLGIGCLEAVGSLRPRRLFPGLRG